MEHMSDEEFEKIYGRPPVRRTVKKKKTKIYWDRIIIALIILVLIICGIVKLITAIVGLFTKKDNKAVDAEVSSSVAETVDSVDESETDSVAFTSANLIVCIDAGHGDYDSGTTDDAETRYEKDDNLAVALSVQKYLEEYGVTVIMTRTDDTFLELADRCTIANESQSDFFICLHRNSYEDDISGVETWVNNSEPVADTLLAQNIMSGIEAVGISDNRGVKYGYVGNPYINYYVNADTIMPSCLVELGFLTDETDNELFDIHYDEYAKAIADAAVQTAIQLGVIDENGNRILEGQLISEEKPINRDDSSSTISTDRTEPDVSDGSVYNIQENEYAE